MIYVVIIFFEIKQVFFLADRLTNLRYNHDREKTLYACVFRKVLLFEIKDQCSMLCVCFHEINTHS